MPICILGRKRYIFVSGYLGKVTTSAMDLLCLSLSNTKNDVHCVLKRFTQIIINPYRDFCVN